MKASRRLPYRSLWFWIFWAALSALGTLIFSFLVAPVLRVLLQSSVGRWIYGGILFLSALGFWVPELEILSLLFFSCWAVVWVYSLLENLRPHWRYLNIGASVYGVSVFGVVVAGVFFPSEALEPLRASLSHWPQFAAFKDFMGFSMFELLPAFYFFFNLGNLLFALMLDRKVAQILKVPFWQPSKPIKFLDYRASDLTMWLFLVSVFLAVFKEVPTEVRILFANLSLIFASFFMFQALAVIETLFYLFRAGLFMRVFVYVVLATHFFFLSLAIGLADYWLDLRKRALKAKRGY